jgi:hypothetical protein
MDGVKLSTEVVLRKLTSVKALIDQVSWIVVIMMMTHHLINTLGYRWGSAGVGLRKIGSGWVPGG